VLCLILYHISSKVEGKFAMKNSLIFAAIAALFAFTTVASANTGGSTETTASSPVDACNGKSDGDSCSFTKDKKAVSGTCQRGEDGKTSCVEKK